MATSTTAVNGLPRDPNQIDARTKRFMNMLSALVTSLLQQEIIIQTTVNNFTIGATDQMILASQIYGR